MFLPWNDYEWKEILCVVDKCSSGYMTLNKSLSQAGDTYFALWYIWLEQTECTTFTIHKLCWSAAEFPDVLLSWLSTVGMYVCVCV